MHINEFAEILLKSRKQKGLSQSELAKKSGFTKRAIQYWEKGKKSISLENADRLKDERIMSAKDRQVALSDIARNDGQDTSDRIRAIDTLNKMTGEYTVKVDAKVEQSEKLSDVFRQLGGEGLSE